MTMATAGMVTSGGVLGVLSKERLDQFARDLGVVLPLDAQKSVQVSKILATKPDLGTLLAKMTRDELRAACRAHSLDHKGRSRLDLMARLGVAPQPAKPDEADQFHHGQGLPSPGDLAVVRHRQYLVTAVHTAPVPGQQTLVKLICLDDDAAGRELDVLWERELGARVITPEAKGLGDIEHLDQPRHFAAYLHALKWNAVTSTNGKLFQSPFRAGIKLMRHQLVPLMKALELPRANLFIADDVGLGKTIEAGLVMQELLLRQRVDQILIVCPASVCLQWQSEMEKKFGLRFEIYNRAFVGRRRQERGFGVNAWTTYPRFIISYQTLRRPEYRDLLLAHLGDQARRSLLVIDEAHNAAPATAAKYAVDSSTTQVIRDVARVFEHRLFLSATPHNGHSNSFTALLEILDNHRFTRGVPLEDRSVLDEVMVRRLKRDIKAIELTDEYPDRHVIQIALAATAPKAAKSSWTATYSEGALELDSRDLEDAGTADLLLSELLRRYASVAKVNGRRGRFALVNLQKRLLSSVEAFARTLRRHAKAVAPDLDLGEAPFEVDDATAALNDEYGSEDDSEDEEARADNYAVAAQAGGDRLLAEMIGIADRHRNAPCPKVIALVEWIKRHQCAAVAVGGVSRSASRADRQWRNTRLIIFTEYAHTKAYLKRQLLTAIEGSEASEARIMEFQGAMSDEQRESIQRAFNGPPERYPVRILLCTDAAREGVNLQGHCHNLFHYDVPWNPGRIEQRNGRIDRTLQQEKDVYCHYFVYPQRVEDRVLEVLVNKVERIQRELGSLGMVIAEQLGDVLEDGIDEHSLERLNDAENMSGAVERYTRSVTEELASFADAERHRLDIENAADILNKSRETTSFKKAHLRDAIDVGLELSGAGPLVVEHPEETQFRLPELPSGWTRTLDMMRPPRAPDQDYWEWRNQPPLPVVFEPPEKMTSGLVHLHLHHPFVQRILSRFLAQGYAANDLSRVTVVKNDQDSITRVIAFGRLTLYGHRASRQHEELVEVSARWLEGKGGLKPFAEVADRKALERLEELLERSPKLDVAKVVIAKLCASAPRDFAALWPHVKAEAEHRQHTAREQLKARGVREARQLRQILQRQREAIQRRLAGTQLQLFATEDLASERLQKKQFEEDRKHMERRLSQMTMELESEPALVEKSYEVVRARLEPVGLVYLWSANR
jgi:superfamily II DNA or RNA helicase